MKTALWVSAAALAFLPLASQATEITSQLKQLSAQRWEVDLTVVNNTLPGAIGEFAVFFSETAYANLAAPGFAGTWDPFIGLPDLGLQSPGYVDFLALATPLAPGASLGGFSITFDYLGSGTPGSFGYAVYSLDGLSQIDAGTTTSAIAAVPEPDTAALMLAGLLAAGVPLWAHKRSATRERATSCRIGGAA